MDGHGGIEILHALSPSSSVAVDFSLSAYARTPSADADLEAGIEARWQTALRKNASLFNGSKFRFAGCIFRPESGPLPATLTIQLGLTDYRTFQGTHGADEPLATFGRASLASPIGNTVVVETKDGKVAMLERARAVGEGGGTAVFAGGHPEPSEVTLSSSDADNNAAVRSELWNGAYREVLEELFVTREQAGPPEGMRCLGIVARKRDAKVCQVFCMRVSSTAGEVERQYADGNSRQEESCSVLFVDKGEMGDVYAKRYVNGLRLMPEAVGALRLWLDDRGLEAQGGGGGRVNLRTVQSGD